MKTIPILLLTVGLLAAKPVTLKLQFKDGDVAPYPEQIQTEFAKLLASDPELARDFAKFQSPPPDGERGDSAAKPTIAPLIISQADYTDFHGDDQSFELKQTIALYYRFDNSSRRGGETTSGFFAVFAVTGSAEFNNPDKGPSKVMKSELTATFQGFSRTLTAPNPDTPEEAKPEK